MLSLCTISCAAQMNINNASIYLAPNAVIGIHGNGLSGNADILGKGKIILNGIDSQFVSMNNFSLPQLEINNPQIVSLTSNLKLSSSLFFSLGKLKISENNLILSDTAYISNADSSKFVVTNGSGKLIRSALGNSTFLFPVGFSPSTFNPVSITNNGTADNIGVSCLENTFKYGISGSVITNAVVDASWNITEETTGGSILTITGSWYNSDELPNFNRYKSGIAHFVTFPQNELGWNLLNNELSLAQGNNPYTYTKTGITDLGVFAVGNKPLLSPLLVSPKIFLQGAYNINTGLMSDDLRTLNLLPQNEPYVSMLTFTHNGSGGEEIAENTIIGSSATSSNNAITDWVFLQLHDMATGNVISTKSALLQRDGDVVDTDGFSPVNMAGNPSGNYFLSVRHRNHLGARTANTFALSKTNTRTIDFTNSISNVFQGTVTNNPLATLNAGVYGLWAGNVNDDRSIKMTGLSTNNNDYLKLLNILGANTNTITNVYSKQDLNLDGTINMTGLSIYNNDYLRLLNTLNSSTNTITQPSF